ncbi:Acetyltransferase (GNAT) family protein [Paenibacillus sp. CF095]|uniref:GNAT family N-acetyltransferase n=1 Tax=Paenibacillus sp. CF095 TaxID=1881033 RepID=UPI000883E469|nr:GNAT family N-acetyltransferase [Paenibacillus sp. CF095]SDD50858.1 Acetyltransferase (GNAT) family protein [Paenibacillus sp. CF095]
MSMNIKPFQTTILEDLKRIENHTREVYPDYPVWANWVYLNNPELKDDNIFVSYSNGEITGYGHVLPRLALNNDPIELPHTIYFDMNVSLKIQDPRETYEALFNALRIRGQQLLNQYPLRNAEWCIQHYRTLDRQLDFVKSKGFYRVEGYWLLEKSLEDVSQNHELSDFNIIQWDIDSLEEQDLFLKLEKEAFPEETPTLDKLSALKALPSWRTYAAKNLNNNVVGLIMVHYDPGKEKGYIDDIFTLQEYQGKGVARALLTQGLQYLSDIGASAAQLHVADSNERAMRLYKRAEFKDVQEQIEFRMTFQ